MCVFVLLITHEADMVEDRPFRLHYEKKGLDLSIR